MEKAKEAQSGTATVQDVDDAERHQLERRTSAVHDAWPTPELADDPTLSVEATKEKSDHFLVTFDDGDPLDPKVCPL